MNKQLKHNVKTFAGQDLYTFRHFCEIEGTPEEIEEILTEFFSNKKDEICAISVQCVNNCPYCTELQLYYRRSVYKEIAIIQRDQEKEYSYPGWETIPEILDYYYDILNKIFPDFNFNITGLLNTGSFVMYDLDCIQDYDVCSLGYAICLKYKYKKSHLGSRIPILGKKINKNYKIESWEYYLSRESYPALPKCYARHNQCLEDLSHLEIAKVQKRLTHFLDNHD